VIYILISLGSRRQFPVGYFFEPDIEVIRDQTCDEKPKRAFSECIILDGVQRFAIYVKREAAAICQQHESIGGFFAGVDRGVGGPGDEHHKRLTIPDTEGILAITRQAEQVLSAGV